jgi:hypothetical protein
MAGPWAWPGDPTVAIAPREAAPTVIKAAAEIFNLVRNMALKTPSVRDKTEAGTVPAVASCTAAWVVDFTRADDTTIEAASEEENAPSTTTEGARPRRISRPRSRSRPRNSRLRTVPIGRPSR